MATIIYRQLSSQGDPLRGNNLNDFLTDLDAVAQAIQTSLKLLQGEWWENLNAGLPLFQNILGVANTSNGVGLLIRQTILGVPYVIAVNNMVVTYAGATRAYTFSCQVVTQFGVLNLESQPLPGLTAGGV